MKLKAWFKKHMQLIKDSAHTRGGVFLILIFAALMIALAVFLFLTGTNTEDPAESSGKKVLLLLLVLEPLLLLTLLRILCVRDVIREPLGVPRFLFFSLFYGLLWHVAAELTINECWWKISPLHVAMDVGICAAVFAILLLLTNSMIFAGIAGSVFYFLFAGVEYFTIEVRGTPVMYTDLLDANAAVSVLGSYRLVPGKKMLAAAVLLIVVNVNLLWKRHYYVTKQRLGRILIRAAGVLLALALVFGIGSSAAFTKAVGKISGVRPQQSFKKVGSQLAFIQSIKNTRIEAPEGYSPGRVEALAAAYIEKAAAHNASLSGSVSPNVIVVMDESFADLDVTGEHALADLVMPNYQSLQENAVKGKTMVSTTGGGTSRSEMEYNTGTSMHLFDLNFSPYSLFGARMNYSLARKYKEQGYHTIAIHPHVRNNYNRPTTYAAMGFDEYLSREDFADPSLVRNYVSDESAFEKITELIGETEDPLFLFEVTMQNHGGYTDEEYAGTVTLDEAYPTVNQFVSLISESDRALGKLMGDIKDCGEKTIVVFFGDHFPALPSEFYKSYNGFDRNSGNVNESQLYYQTPYFIWANYDLSMEEAPITSLNYLGEETLKLSGSKLSGFDVYLQELEEKIPALSGRVWYGTDGLFHEYGTDAEVDALMNEYDCIEYNDLIDVRNRCDAFFEIAK